MTGAITVLGTLPFNSNVISDTIRYLSGAVTAVNRGQVWDLRRTPNDNLRGLYRLKTGALFRAALVIGARLALNSSGTESSDNSDEIFAVFGRLGDEIGILFQLLDDLIDKTEEKGRLGLSSDLRLEKKTISELDSDIASEYVVTTVRGIFGAYDDLTRLGVAIEKTRGIIDPLITKISNLIVGSDIEQIDSSI
jgi:geranylgeranyl pyrophosphate synthase